LVGNSIVIVIFIVSRFVRNKANSSIKFVSLHNHSLQPTILNDVNQFKVGLESDKGYFTLKVDNDVDVPLFLPVIVH
jgi:hypothetical protein